jgi:2'-5' RNA ligase
VYSLNVPVPNDVRRLAAELDPQLAPFDSVRDRHTLLLKRFEGERSRHRLREQLDDALDDATPFRARITGIDSFENPPAGTAPVVYLAVESPGMHAVHERLVAAFGGVEGLEGDGYTPHVTLARGYDAGRGFGIPDTHDPVAQLRAREIEPVEWTVDELGIWSREYAEIVSRVPL